MNKRIVITVRYLLAGFSAFSMLLSAIPAIATTQGSITQKSSQASNRTDARSRVYFEENRGQQDKRVKYFSRGGGTEVFLTATEAVYVVRSRESAVESQESEIDARTVETLNSRHSTRDSTAVAVYMRLAGANEVANFEPSQQLEHRTNYFKGNDPNGWQAEIPNYQRITAESIYSGINLVWQGKEHGDLQYDFVVKPFADPSVIEWEVEGADDVLIHEDGSLVIKTAAGEMRQSKPFTYQEDEGSRTEVPSTFTLAESDVSQPTKVFSVKFAVGDYDRSKVLTIDPMMGLNDLGYSTFLGGGSDDEGKSIAVDSDGIVYITGSTLSTAFPTTAGAYDTTYNGSSDVFVTKLNADGSSLVYSTFIGGSSGDNVTNLVVDSSGNAFVTGFTVSTDYPTTAGAYDTTYGGGDFDVFVTKLNAAGSSLVYSTFIGGSGYDSSNAITVDSSGNAHVTGWTDSPAYPTTPGAYQTTKSVAFDAFVTKLNSVGSSIVYSTFIGGTDWEAGSSIAVDSSGSAFVAGFTKSPAYPTTAGAFDTTHNGDYDVFVTKLNGAGSSLVYSTFIGGSSDDLGIDIVVDPSGIAFVTGYTASPAYPTTVGAYDTTHDGGDDVLVTKLNAAGSSLVYSTFVGGSSDDAGSSIAVDSSGTAFVTGHTASPAYPTTMGAYDTTHNGGDDVLVTKLNAAGSSLVYSTFIGGSSDDEGNGLAVDLSGNIFVTGFTTSTDYPTTTGVYDTTHNGGDDVFVTRIGDEPLGPVLGIYPPTSVALGDNISILPSFAPINTLRTTASTSTSFIGELTVDPVSGIVRLTNASHANIPAGTYPVTITALGSTGTNPATATFNLTVNNVPICTPTSFATAVVSTVGTSPQSPVIGDFNGDGNQDVAVANASTNNVSVLIGDGLGGLAPAVNYATGSFLTAITIGDFDGDGIQDIAATKESGSAYVILKGNGDGTFVVGPSISVGVNPRSIAVGDFNEDGVQDIVVGNFSANYVSVMLGTGAGAFGGAINYTVGTISGSARQSSIAVADFNNDGNQDLVTTNFTQNGISILSGNGLGSFSAPINFTALGSPTSVVIGDFNSDGDQDFAFLTTANTVTAMLGNGDFTFAPPIDLIVANGLTSIAVGEFNGDGHQDLAAIYAGNAAILNGNGTGNFTSSGVFSSGGGLANGFGAVGDLNGDGNQDVIATHTGGGSTTLGLLRRTCAVTAANVSVSGRVLTPGGNGLWNARVNITDATGLNRTTITSSFGYFRIDGLEAGSTVVLSVSAKRFNFEPMLVTLSDDITDLEIMPTGESFR